MYAIRSYYDFEAKRIGDKDRDAILDELFEETLNRLFDYSSASVAADTPTAVLPVRTFGSEANSGTADAGLKANAEYFGLRMLQAASSIKRMRVVEREDLQSVMAEWELRLSGLGDSGRNNFV